MSSDYQYRPSTTVDWSSRDAHAQFIRWEKEVKRIVNGPMAEKSDEVKLNIVYIWAGGEAKQLIEAKQAENPELEVEDVEQLLEALRSCLTHTTYFREACEDFYNARQKPGENSTSFYSRLIKMHKEAEFPENSTFLITDKLINGCLNTECKKKTDGKGERCHSENMLRGTTTV